MSEGVTNLNPYAPFLGDRDPLEVVRETPDRLAGIAARLDAGRLEWRPAPAKWNAREVFCHLADTEIAFAFRLRQAIAEDHHVIQPFDQERWAAAYAHAGAPGALDVFAALRRWNLSLVESRPSETFAKRLTHPERGEMTFRVLVETMAGHDLNHLRQLDAIVAGR